MSKTIIVSNRLPVKAVEKDGAYQFTTAAGGLATGLSSIFSEDKQSVWIGWPGLDVPADKENDITKQLSKDKLLPVFLSAEEITQFYEGFSNEILWPVFHYMSTYANFETTYWEYYKSVNQKFCDAVLKVAEPNDVIWVHDYQLLLLPTLLRKQVPDLTIGFFLHIPFPSYELFRLIPWRSELLNGMLGADLLGFHTYDDAHHFLISVSRILQITYSANMLTCENRTIVVESFPMGIDDKKFDQLIDDKSVQENIAQLQQDFPNLRIILSIDRLDYSKGILQRLQAFDIFLQNNPDYLQLVSLYMIVVPSRDKVQQYRDLRDEIDKLVGNINSRFRTNNWSPVHYFYRSFKIEELSALFQFAEVCLVTPMRDGMNLVCKEYIASRRNADGVLILSEMAGFQRIDRCIDRKPEQCVSNERKHWNGTYHAAGRTAETNANHARSCTTLQCHQLGQCLHEPVKTSEKSSVGTTNKISQFPSQRLREGKICTIAQPVAAARLRRHAHQFCRNAHAGKSR